MSELTNIHARSVKDLTTPTELPVDTDALDQVKLVAGNFPAEYVGNEAMTVGMIKDLAAQGREEELEAVNLKIANEEIRAKEVEAALIKDKANKASTLEGYGITNAYNQGQIDSKVVDLENKKANKIEVNTAISNLSTTANKYYSTLAAANADIANIALNQSVTIGEEANSGLWYKATAGATTLTKSPYDPYTLGKQYTLEQADKVRSENLGEKADLNVLFIFEDSDGKVVALVKPDGNIITSKANLHELKSATDFLTQFNLSIEESDGKVGINELNENLFDFEDATGKKVVSFKKTGVIKLNNETNISRTSVNSGEISAGLFQKEYAESNYLNLNLQRLLLSNVSTLSPFVGSHKQQFSIKNANEFLNLKISQGNVLSIDTPYYKKDTHVFSNQVVHPYICKFQKTVMGYKWIMLITPFHSTNDMYENPCVYGSNDLKNFELLDTFEQPIMGLLPTGEYNYNSDPSCVFDHGTGEFCVISRNTQDTSGSSLYVLRTKDFVNWGEPELMDIADGLSPSIIFDTSINKWVLYSYYNNTSFSRKVADKLEGPWTVSDVITPPFNVWHQEIRFCGTHYVGVFGDNKLNTGGALYLGISVDGINWQFSGDIFEGAHFPAYKPSITHEFVGSTHIKFHIVWTSSDISGVLNEKWKLFSTETQPIEVV